MGRCCAVVNSVVYRISYLFIYIYINTSSSLSTTFASACDKNINKYKVDLTYIHIVRTPSIPLPYGTMIMRASSCAGNSLSMCMYIYIYVDDMYIIFCCCKALHRIVWQGNIAIAEVLLEYGADAIK